MLNKKEIYEIYENYVSINYNDKYWNKYVPLPLYLNNKKWKWKGKDFPRVMALLEFGEYMSKLNIKFESVLSFNGEFDPELEYLQYEKLYNYNYEDNVKYDLHCLELDKKDFDFVMINQTIEHLYDPILALKNIYNHMKIGGIFYTNVPVNNIPHSMPYHYYTGITPVGLGIIIKLAGFEVLKIGQWGNREYLRKSYERLWPDYTYSSNPGKNEIECPLITWCFAIRNK